MIELWRYDARDDAQGLDVGGPRRMRGLEVEVAAGLLGIVTAALEHLGASIKQRRLRKVLRQYPRSLVCPGCGYLDRQR